MSVSIIKNCDCYYGILLWDYADELPEYTKNNRVLKNIVSECWNKNKDDLYGNYLRLNKFLVSEKDLTEHMNEYLSECEDNLVYVSAKMREAGVPAPCVRLNAERDIPLDEWRRNYGYDLRTEVGDPLFRDTKNGDFSFPQNSPASLLGIKPLSTEFCGAEKTVHSEKR